MTRRQITILILVGALAIILGWDLYVALRYDWDSTVSAVIYDFLRLHVMIPLSIGVVIGHFAWPIQRDAR